MKCFRNVSFVEINEYFWDNYFNCLEGYLMMGLIKEEYFYG